MTGEMNPRIHDIQSVQTSDQGGDTVEQKPIAKESKSDRIENRIEIAKKMGLDDEIIQKIKQELQELDKPNAEDVKEHERAERMVDAFFADAIISAFPYVYGAPITLDLEKETEQMKKRLKESIQKKIWEDPQGPLNSEFKAVYNQQSKEGEVDQITLVFIEPRGVKFKMNEGGDPFIPYQVEQRPDTFENRLEIAKELNLDPKQIERVRKAISEQKERYEEAQKMLNQCIIDALTHQDGKAKISVNPDESGITLGIIHQALRERFKKVIGSPGIVYNIIPDNYDPTKNDRIYRDMYYGSGGELLPKYAKQGGDMELAIGEEEEK